MTATVADLAARALRKLGVCITSPSNRPGLIGTVTTTDIAARALRSLGVEPLNGQNQLPTNTTYTQAQVANELLVKLGVIAPDETPAAQDLAEASDRVQSVHDMMSQLDYAAWAIGVIPSYAVEPYIIMASNLLAPYFGKQGSVDSFNSAQEILRQIVLSGPYGQQIAIKKVQSVHDALVLQGIASWSLDETPVAFAEDYVQMVELYLAPVMRGKSAASDEESAPDRQADTAMFQAAMERIRQGVRVMNAQPLAEQKIRDVHSYLDALGKTRWSIFDVPDYVEDTYIQMAAFKLGPEFPGSKFDPRWWQGGEMAINRLISMPDDQEPTRAVYF